MEVRTEDKMRLIDIADAIQEIKGYLEGEDYEEYLGDENVQQSVTTQLSFIGGAAAMLTDEFKEEYGDIDWDVLKGFQYAQADQELEIDPHQALSIAQRDLPEMMEDILDLASTLEAEEDLDEETLNNEDKLDQQDLVEARKLRNGYKPEEEFNLDSEEKESIEENRIEDYDEEDDSFPNKRFGDEGQEL